MATTPTTAFRLTQADLGLLDDLSASWATTRTDGIRRAVRDAYEQLDGPQRAAGRFIKSLRDNFGPHTFIEFQLDCGNVEARVKDHDKTLRAVVVSEPNGIELLYLEDRKSGASLRVAAVPFAADAPVTLAVPIGSLRPSMADGG